MDIHDKAFKSNALGYVTHGCWCMDAAMIEKNHRRTGEPRALVAPSLFILKCIVKIIFIIIALCLHCSMLFGGR
jgi:hypothetical protein